MPHECCNREYDRRAYAAADRARHEALLARLRRELRGYRGFLRRVVDGRVYCVFPLTRGPHAAEFGYWNVSEPDARLLDLDLARGDAVYLALHFDDGGRVPLVRYGEVRAERRPPAGPHNTPYRQFFMTRAEADAAGGMPCEG